MIPGMAKQHAAAFILFAFLAIVMTWPLLPNIGRAVAYPGDPYINTWVLDWDWYATFHQPGRLFQANIFYPAKYSLAFSENLYGIALFLFPLRALGVGAVAAMNTALTDPAPVIRYGDDLRHLPPQARWCVRSSLSPPLRPR